MDLRFLVAGKWTHVCVFFRQFKLQILSKRVKRVRGYVHQLLSMKFVAIILVP